MTKLLPFNFYAPKWHLAYFVPIDGHFGQIGRYGLQICFAQAVTLTFWSIFGDRMANLGMIVFKIGLYIKVNVTAKQI